MLKPLSGALCALLAATANAQDDKAAAVQRCALILNGGETREQIPSLSLKAVRERACACLVADPGAVAGETADRCIQAAVLAEPIPPLTPRTVSALANAAAPDGKRSTRTGPMVRINGCKRPEYPAAAVRAEATGTTRLVFRVAPDGKVADAEITKSSGTTVGHKLLDASALVALMQCPFTPGTDDGKPVEGTTIVEYVWKLE
ncbi:energy transducer TonB [Aquabacterium humicola]|uniref:energy transducer TonB n=1 Tax=Aquabacterium humicola TaxID=3237377 RepID=UPI00254389ED|nr:energy transducer TonB [Rubrivivax pictus]